MKKLRLVAACCLGVLLLLPTAGQTLPPGKPALVAIQVLPAASRLAVGTTRQMTAIGVYSDSSTRDLTATAHWASSAPAVATVHRGSGFVAARSAGMTFITVQHDRLLGATSLTVTDAVLVNLTISPVNPAVASRAVMQLTAIGTFSDASTQDLTDQVTWSSDNGKIAKIGNLSGKKGRLNGRHPGQTSIRARRGAVSASTTAFVS